MTGDVRVPPSKGSGIYLGLGHKTITIGGDSADEKNNICGNYISGIVVPPWTSR